MQKLTVAIKCCYAPPGEETTTSLQKNSRQSLSRVARSVLGEIFLIFILVSRIVCGWVPFFNFFLSVGSVIPSYVVLKRDSLLSIRKTKRKHNVIA